MSAVALSAEAKVSESPVPVKVLVVDDLTILRAGIREIFGRHDDLEIVGEATSAADALRQTLALRPQVIVVNAMGRASNALDIVRTIANKCGDQPPGMVLLANSADHHSEEVLRAGATGLVLHHSHPEHLLAAVRMVAAGYWVVADPEPAAKHCERTLIDVRANVTQHRQLHGVSQRETEVLTLVARGLSNAEIAQELILSESTVKSHIQHLLEKLQLKNRVQAVIFAYEVGFIRIGAKAVPTRAVPG